jgi:uncharacterized BrkB/YihY/UPF0761 family membrane protein
MKMFKRKKGQVWILLVFILMVFAIAGLFMLFFPVFDKVDTVITPMITDPDWQTVRASYVRIVWLIPVITFICLLIWLVIQWSKNSNQQNYGG